jgi:hypothetical protein
MALEVIAIDFDDSPDGWVPVAFQQCIAWELLLQIVCLCSRAG